MDVVNGQEGSPRRSGTLSGGAEYPLAGGRTRIGGGRWPYR